MKRLNILMSVLVLALAAVPPAMADAQKATLQITTLVDYENSRALLETEKTFSVDLAFVEKNSLDMYVFSYGEDKVCFTGDAKEASEIVQAILATATGDSFTDPKKPVVKKDSIKQVVPYESEAGASEFKIAINRCK